MRTAIVIKMLQMLFAKYSARKEMLGVMWLVGKRVTQDSPKRDSTSCLWKISLSNNFTETIKINVNDRPNSKVVDFRCLPTPAEDLYGGRPTLNSSKFPDLLEEANAQFIETVAEQYSKLWLHLQVLETLSKYLPLHL